MNIVDGKRASGVPTEPQAAKTPLDFERRSRYAAVAGLLGGCRHGADADEAAMLTLVAELDDAVDLREERVVAADADVHARVEAGTALANENRSTGNELTGETLDAEHFRLRIATVARRALSFFMSHGKFLLPSI
jgi:hypothetical protein